MTPQELKNSILQLAIQGKLVEQRPEEGTAEVEYSSLLTIKPTFEEAFENSPIEIPDSWIWVSFESCCMMYTGNSISETEKNAKYVGLLKGYDYIGTKNVSFERVIEYDNGVRIPFETDFKIAPEGSVLMCIEGGSAGRKIGVLDRNVCFGNKLCMFNSSNVLNKYIYYYLQSATYKEFFVRNMTGIIGGVSLKKLKGTPIPLPPLAEQKRIVAKLEELLPLCERYGEAWSKLEALEARFPGDLKKSLLQLAIQGKLVEQRPEEGTAEVEYSSLLTIKPTFEEAFENSPIEIPDSWIWVSFESCCMMYTGNSISETEKNAKYVGLLKGYDYIGTKNVSFERVIEYDNGVRIPFETDFKIAPEGSVLMCIEGGSAGRKIGVLDRNVCFGNKLCMFNSSNVLNKYIYYYLQSATYKEFFVRNMTGIIGGVSLKKLKGTPIPLPPLSEQKRIVAKLEELLPLCDKLTGKL